MPDFGRQIDYMTLLRPSAIERIGRLGIVARGVMEGFVVGRHRSPYKGFSSEFAEHRQYVPGDDIADMDWRVYGKSDRYYVKTYVEETNLRATILLDASGSMAFRGEKAAQIDGKPISKFEYGRYIAATLTYVMIHQQDAVGAVTFDHQIRRYIPARSRASHLRGIMEELYQTTPGKESKIAPILNDIAERIHRRGMVIIISDLFDDVEDIARALHHFRFRKHEVILFHIMAEEELTFPFGRWTNFKDLEAGRDVPLDPGSIRAEYLHRVREFIRRIEHECGQLEIDYVPLCTSEGYEKSLADYLAERHSRT